MTLPVGVPALLVTVAVNATELPYVDGFNEDVTRVVVAGLSTVNAPVKVVVPPTGATFVTETSRGPVAAVDAIVMFAVICVPLSTDAVLTVMLGPKLTELTPLMKFVPVKTTFSVCVRVPLVGAMLIKVGA